MVDIHIGADMAEAVRASLAVGDATVKSAKAGADAVAKIGDAWVKAGAKSEKVLREQYAMVERMALRADKAAAAANQRSFNQGHGEFTQRATAANLDLANRRHQADISKVMGETMIANAKGPQPTGGLIESAKEKFGGLVAEIAGVSAGLAALKFVLGSFAADRQNAGRLSEEVGARRKQTGNDAAVLGLSKADMQKIHDANGLTTVAENEEFIHKAAASQSSKPFGMPRVGGKEIMALMDKYQRTGNGRLVDVLNHPAAVPGNVDALSNMMLSADAGNPGDLKGAEKNYRNRLPGFAKREMGLQRDISVVDDAITNSRYSEGIDQREADAGRRAMRNSGTVGRWIAGAQDVADWVDVFGGLSKSDQSTYQELKAATNGRKDANGNGKSTPQKVQVVSPPRPTTRHGDQ